MIQKTYYDIPTKVKFYDNGKERPRTHVGIAYCNQIICMCCGDVFPLNDNDENVEILKEMDWFDFSEYVDT